MAKRKDGTTRATYSVRLNPDLLRILKHVAVDEDKTIGELLEEGIRAVIKERKAGAGYAAHHTRVASKDEGVDVHSDNYQIPEFLRKRSAE